MMRSKNLVRRVLPISVFVAVLLIQFQNCAKTVGLQDDPMTGSTHSNIDSPIDFSGDAPGAPIASLNPGNGGSKNPDNVPDCFKITRIEPLYDEQGGVVYEMRISLVKVVADAHTNELTFLKTLPLYRGVLTLKYLNQNVTFQFNNGFENYTLEAVFYVPQEIFSAQSKSALLTGHFSGKLFENLPVTQCASNIKSKKGTLGE